MKTIKTVSVVVLSLLALAACSASPTNGMSPAAYAQWQHASCLC